MAKAKKVVGEAEIVEPTEEVTEEPIADEVIEPVEEIEPIVEETVEEIAEPVEEVISPAKQNFLSFIEKYKSQNPVKYETKRLQLEAILETL